MAQVVKSNGSPTLYTLRRMFGIKARKPNRFARCIGAYLKGKKYGAAPAGMGGRYDERIRSAFKEAVRACKGSGTTAREISLAEQRFLRETGRGG